MTRPAPSSWAAPRPPGCPTRWYAAQAPASVTPNWPKQAAATSHLDKVVANLVAGSGADQVDQLGGFAVRYVLVRAARPGR